MSWDMWLAFVAASVVVLLIPGPTVLVVISQALGQGRRSILPNVAGVALGDAAAMTASLAGLGVLMATSALLFTIFKWMGGAYLLYLGFRMWRSPVADATIEPDRVELPAATMFRTAFMVTALNPKSIMFFVAFAPQFMDPAHAYVPQAALLVGTFVSLAAINVAAYALLATRARKMVTTGTVRRIINRAGGGLMMGAGIAAAMWRPAAS